jgi:hypothetical protein
LKIRVTNFQNRSTVGSEAMWQLASIQFGFGEVERCTLQLVSLLEHWQHQSLSPQASYLLGSYIYERPMMAIGRNLALKA